MKSILMVLAIMFFFAWHTPAQRVSVTAKRTVYTRSRPIAKYKRNFVITYPKVRGATPALSRRIETNISYAKVLGLNLREELSEPQWLEEAGYEVDYNARGILLITLTMNGTAAYPDGVSKTVAIDLATGDRITPAQAFVNIVGLVEDISRKQKLEIEAAIREIRADPEEKDTYPAELFDGETFKRADLAEFTLDNVGITFIHDYGFPHVIQALEPEGRYTYTWAEAARFINRKGPLSRFVGK